MNKRERVIAAIEKKPVDHVPASFSLHFPKEAWKGQAGVDAHLSFMEQTGCDILKVMNENLVPLVGEMNGPADWDQVPAHTKDSPFMRDQLELTKMVLESYKGEAFSLATIHGITASTIHPIEARYGYVPVREMLCEHLRADEKPVLAAMDRIADAMCELVVESASLGIDGIYYASLGGERHFFTDEEFARWIEPFDLRIMKTAREAGLYNFLHICKENLNVQRYANYGELADVVNWGVFETHFSLEEGRKLFPNATIMGGLANRSGVLVEGSLEEIAAAVKKVVAEFGSTGFILGADCTLPTEIALERVKAAVDGVK